MISRDLGIRPSFHRALAATVEFQATIKNRIIGIFKGCLLMGIELYKRPISDIFNDVGRLHCEGGLIALSVRYIRYCEREGSHGYWHC
jgi:hypothetical protein